MWPVSILSEVIHQTDIDNSKFYSQSYEVLCVDFYFFFISVYYKSSI